MLSEIPVSVKQRYITIAERPSWTCSLPHNCLARQMSSSIEKEKRCGISSFKLKYWSASKPHWS